MNNIMVDLETLDTNATSVIISVGAVVFDTEKILRRGYWVLDIDEQVKAGRTVSGSTISWWSQQSDKARKVFVPTSLPWSIANFGTEFKGFFQGEKLAFWGNGSDFDTAIMIDFWNRHGLEKIPGWKYSNNMCFRTFNKMTGCKGMVQRAGVHHHALDDAEFQADCVLAAIKNIANLFPVEPR